MYKLLSVFLLGLLSYFTNGQPPTEKSLRLYLEKTEALNSIEGIWEVELKQEFYHFDTLYDVKPLADSGQIAIVRNTEMFTAYYLTGKDYNIEFTTTDVKGVYMYRNFYPLLSEFSKKQAVICTHGKMEYTYDLPEEYVIKICGDNYQPNTRVVNVLRWKKVFPVTQ